MGSGKGVIGEERFGFESRVRMSLVEVGEELIGKGICGIEAPIFLREVGIASR